MLNSLFAKLYTATRREEGQAMAEYGVILALIAVVAIAVVALLGTDVKNAFQAVVNAI